MVFVILSLTLIAGETPWSDPERGSRDTPWGPQISEERRDSRESFFKSLSLGGPSETRDYHQQASQELSSLPWDSYESDSEGPIAGIQGAGLLWPVAGGKISSGYGPRGGSVHEGVDIKGAQGASIRAAAHGRVVFSGNMNGYGRTLVLYHGDGVATIYAHNEVNLRDRGEVVRQGQMIARLGQSGRATAPHLHFEVRKHGRPLNPMSFSFSRVPAVASRDKNPNR